MRLPNPLSRGSAAVSPTAHYTGHVWGRNDLSHPELSTIEGRILFDALAPAMLASRTLGGPTLEGLLLARHRIIDDLLSRAIDAGTIAQVIEVAAGMSPRGWRFSKRYGDRLTYVEADLPGMARRKREALERIGTPGVHHRVAEVDVLLDDGPQSLSAVASSLDGEAGLAIVTEGLLTYFDEDDVTGMFERFALVQSAFSAGLYLADIRLGDSRHGLPEQAFQVVLSAFVRGQVHTHFDDEDSAARALRAAGFHEARLHRADRQPAAGDAARDPAAARIHIIEASTR